MTPPGSPKDKFFVNVVNPYLAEVKMHPQTLQLKDGVLHKQDLEGPEKEGVPANDGARGGVSGVAGTTGVVCMPKWRRGELGMRQYGVVDLSVAGGEMCSCCSHMARQGTGSMWWWSGGVVHAVAQC